MKALAALLLVVSAGDYDRLDTVVAVPFHVAELERFVKEAGPGTPVLLEEGSKTPIPITWDRGGESDAPEGRLVFFLPGKTPKGTSRTFALSVTRAKLGCPFSHERNSEWDGKYFQLSKGGKPVLRYNSHLMKQFPDKDSKFDRACYFHPLWAPNGEIITGDFNPNHAHHRGLWFAWVKADAGAIKANFWEIQEGRGRIANTGSRCGYGLVCADLEFCNQWTSQGKALIKETLKARVYATPPGISVFDLCSRQEAVEADVVLGKIHYGGLGFRGRDEWDGPKATLEALTSEGKTRKDANQTNARWIDYTGPLGKDGWGGILVIENPANVRYPNRVRVHPTMCFFSTTLVQTEPYTIKKGEPLELRYRIVLHDGKPDKALAERLAADYASPPTVTVRREP